MVKHTVPAGVFCAFFVVLFTSLAHPAPKVFRKHIPEEAAVRIIVNEAGNQGLKGMICVAEVLRNRASTKGFEGYPRSLILRQPKSIRRLAARAWRESAHTNYTGGADHFVGAQAPRPWWVKYCVQTYVYKDHVFYREIRPRRR